MGRYVNKGNGDFLEVRNQTYVDKSGLIAFINKTLFTPSKMTCVSRARRFGKSMALQMLYAYYDCSCDSHALFDDLEISGDPSYLEHLNKYYTVHLDITSFITGASSPERIVDEMVARIIDDIKTEFPEVAYPQWDTLMDVLLSVAVEKGRRFVMLIDEWDALFREVSDNLEQQRQYIKLLRNLFKGDNTNKVFAGVYMTGILPIKSYGTQSALNNFRMYSMTNPEPIEHYFGFTEAEVQALCLAHKVDFEETARWYDGYRLGSNGVGIFNPTSVMTMLTTGVFKGYWTRTESFESVRELINMNFDGVKEMLETMLLDRPVKVVVSTFGNDGNQISSKDELFSLLIHYGYLGFDSNTQRAFIPNAEIRQELLQAVKNGSRPELVKLITESEHLLQKTIEGDELYVAEHFESLHSEKSAPLFYNDEQALRSIIHLAYIAAVDDYVKIQELPSGKGCADVVFLPRRGGCAPAMIVELKFDGSAEGAISQIKNRNYPQLVQGLSDTLLLVGINYNKKSKAHECRIEKFVKTQGVDSRSSRKNSRSIKQDKIIAFCSVPRSLEEIAKELGVSDKYYMKKKYINPLLGSRIRMSNPDTLNSPNQRYVSISLDF